MKNNNEFYTCPYCKEEYSNPVDMARCVLSCEEKERAITERKRQEELANNKEARKNEIEAVAKHYQALVREFIKDYGSYDVIRCYEGEEEDDDDVVPFLFGSKPWRMFF